MFDGDAVQTLRDAPRPVDLEFLDGWKELCLPVLQLVEPSPPPPPAASSRTRRSTKGAPNPASTANFASESADDLAVPAPVIATCPSRQS
jgi:hypothetical protein